MESTPPMQCSPQRGAAAPSTQATVAVGYAFMAKKTASMHRVLSGSAAEEPVDAAEAGDAREVHDRVAFEPFAFDEDYKKVCALQAVQALFGVVLALALR